MQIKTGFWIQVVDNQVKQVWDYRPPQDKIDAEPGWQEAVEAMPTIVPGREIITSHSFDLSTNPPQIVWSKKELTVDERKGGLLELSKLKFQNVVHQELKKQLDEFPETQYDAAIVDAARIVYESEVTEINNATTHEQIDHIQAQINQ